MLVAGTSISHNISNLLRMSQAMPSNGIMLMANTEGIIGPLGPTPLERACIEHMSHQPWLLVLAADDDSIHSRLDGLAEMERPEIEGGPVHALSSNIVLLQHTLIYTITSRPVIFLHHAGRVPDPPANLDRPVLISYHGNNTALALLGDAPRPHSALDDALLSYARMDATWMIGACSADHPVADHDMRITYYCMAYAGHPKMYAL